jgi:hypothetical protein
MAMRWWTRSAGVLLALATAWLPSGAVAQDCDRECLRSMVSRYVDALVARDPSALPLAPDARHTEDGRDIELGAGLWETVSGKGTFRHDYLDPQGQVAGAHVELREGANPVLLSLVLHMDGQQIAGVETIVQRILPESRFQPTELGAPIRGMDDAVPAGQRQSRVEMIATALTYTNGLRIGNFIDAGTPFAPEAYRVENGVITAGEGCLLDECGLTQQRIMVHPSILASVAAVDEENGTVLLWMNFGFTDTYGPGNALVTLEAFKVWGGQIHAINAFFATLPINTPRIWPSLDRATAQIP